MSGDRERGETAPVVTIPNARKLDFISRLNDRRYSLSVRLPFEPAPPSGHPVLYVLDGHAYFASAAEAARFNAPDVVVVGIGYPDDPDYVRDALARHAPLLPPYDRLLPERAAVALERYYDLTLPISDAVLATESVEGMHTLQEKDVGGLGDFLTMIETEIKPRIAAMVPIDRTNQAIFGHSLGGLAVLHALFVAPNAFRTFVASSPSIWRGRRAVLADEAAFAEAVEAKTAAPRVLITMGGEEDVVPPNVAAKLGIDPAELEARIRNNRMIENARELTSRLQALKGTSAYHVENYAVFPKQGHGIAPWPALGRAIAFAFPT